MFLHFLLLRFLDFAGDIEGLLIGLIHIQKGLIKTPLNVLALEQLVGFVVASLVFLPELLKEVVGTLLNKVQLHHKWALVNVFL